MNYDPFTKELIYQDPIWKSSQCLEREGAILDTISQRLARKGWTNVDQYRRHWTKGQEKIVLCLVDDTRSCSHDYETDMPYLFDSDTTVITDNFISCPTRYKVLKLPDSFFGIYCHEPPGEWIPDRGFCFSVNRLDDRRFLLLLEIVKRLKLDRGYINFNCQTDFVPDSTHIDFARLQQNFYDHWDHLSDDDRMKYQQCFDLVKDQMPYKNYTIAHDEIHLRSRCNIVVESYGSDTTVALSEKTFRALVLPVPWTVYAGHYAIAFLESLGFDCMSDLINHNHYDQLKEVEDKVHIFIWKSIEYMNQIIRGDHEKTAQRCLQAAEHNRKLLRHFRSTWPNDFERWWTIHFE